MKTLTTIIAFVLFACKQSTTATNNKVHFDTVSTKTVLQTDNLYDTVKKVSDRIYEGYISPQLKKYLNKELPGWTLLSPGRWDKYWFNEYKKIAHL